jgi:hypothetical protein
VAWTSPRRRDDAALRKEIQARATVDFRADVDLKADILGFMLTARGPLNLIVSGDAFAISHPFPLARVLFGQEYVYRAGDTAIEVVPGLRHDWIEVTGSGARIQIGRRKRNREIWDALVRAGAQPAGPPPAR